MVRVMRRPVDDSYLKISDRRGRLAAIADLAGQAWLRAVTPSSTDRSQLSACMRPRVAAKSTRYA